MVGSGGVGSIGDPNELTFGQSVCISLLASLNPNETRNMAGFRPLLVASVIAGLCLPLTTRGSAVLQPLCYWLSPEVHQQYDMGYLLNLPATAFWY